MSLDTESDSPTVRDHLEASYASHTPGGPDVDFDCLRCRRAVTGKFRDPGSCRAPRPP